MSERTNHPRNFTDELRAIPLLAGILAAVAFLGVPVVFFVAMARQPNAPPPVLRAFFGLLVGTIAACYVLLVGYINQDAGRRGMSRLWWTLLAVFVPNAFGIILYFILRRPLPATCPQCGSAVEAGFGFCPHCRYRLQPVCPQCQRGVMLGSLYCPYCGATLNQPASPSLPQQV